MRLIIAIVLGTFTFQCASFQLGLGGYDASRHHDGSNFLSKLLYGSTREKSSSNRDRTRRGTQRYTNYRKVKIYNVGTHYLLQVSANGRVNGTRNDDSNNVWFRMESYGTSKIRLLNLAQNRYVAINHKGVVISQKSMTEESLLYHYIDDAHDRFSSTRYPSTQGNNRDKWLLTIKKSGKVKNAKRTKPKMKSTHFMIMS